MCDVPNGARYCPDCRHAVEVFDDHASGNTVCTQCGRVLGQRYVDKSSEWRAFLDDVGGIDGRGRLDAADPVQPDADAVTIAYPPPAGNAQSPEASDKDDMHGAEGVCTVVPRMRGAFGAAGHPRGGAMPKMRGTVPDASHSIDGMAESLGLPAAVRDRAREVLKKLDDAKVLPKCRKRNALYAACLHFACRAGGTPRTFKELASVAGDNATAGVKDIGRIVKQMKGHLGEEDSGQAVGEITARPGDYLRRFGSLLEMGDQEVNAALEAARRLEHNLDVRRNPDSIAAALIYMAIKRAAAGKSISDVSTVTGVSEVTIREVYHKDLRPHADLLFG